MSQRKPTTGSRRITDAATPFPASNQLDGERGDLLDDLYESLLYARLEADAQLHKPIDADREA